MEDLIQQLRDIHLPNEPALWPLAWGWWLIVTVALCFVCALIAYAVYKRLKIIPWDWQKWDQEADERKGILANQWLKQAALLRFERKEIARLNGTEWVVFLQENGIECDAPIAYWISTGYLLNQPPPKEAAKWLQNALLKLSNRDIVIT